MKGRTSFRSTFHWLRIPWATCSWWSERYRRGLKCWPLPSVQQLLKLTKNNWWVSRGVMTLEDVAWDATARHRFRAVLVATFAGLALLLAMVGLFGILAYSVQQRLREFGIRKALGATTGAILRLVYGSAARMIVIGVVIGLTVSAGLSRVLTTMLFGVEPLDMVTFAFVTVLVAITGVASIAGPAWRAIRIDPMAALREE